MVPYPILCICALWHTWNLNCTVADFETSHLNFILSFPCINFLQGYFTAVLKITIVHLLCFDCLCMTMVNCGCIVQCILSSALLYPSTCNAWILFVIPYWRILLRYLAKPWWVARLSLSDCDVDVLSPSGQCINCMFGCICHVCYCNHGLCPYTHPSPIVPMLTRVYRLCWVYHSL